MNLEFVLVLEIATEGDHCSIRYWNLFDKLVGFQVDDLGELLLLLTSGPILCDCQNNCGHLLGAWIFKMCWVKIFVPNAILEFMQQDLIVRAKAVVVDLHLQLI